MANNIYLEAIFNDKALVISHTGHNEICVLTTKNKQHLTSGQLIERFKQVPANERILYIRVLIPKDMASEFSAVITNLQLPKNSKNVIDLNQQLQKRTIDSFVENIDDSLLLKSDYIYISVIRSATEMRSIVAAMKALFKTHESEFTTHKSKLNNQKYVSIRSMAEFIDYQVEDCIDAVK